MDVSLIIDWLGDEGPDLLSWWLLVTLAGAAVWPLLMRILGGLPDRGYTLARAAGLMLTGFVFWFLASLGLLRNTPGAMVFAWLVVLAISLAAFFRWQDRPALRPWWRDHWRLVLLTEVLFLLLLVGWAVYRAHNPEMRSTEKPMEIMFLNGIRASDTFPPRDPWLADYAISYYYFGYLIMAMLADLSGVSSGIAFNITNALLFALTGIGALGVVYNMVRTRGTQVAALAAGVLGMCFLVLMGNLGTALIELPYRGYVPGLVNQGYFEFWDVAEREGTLAVAQPDGTTVLQAADADRDTIPNWDDDAQPVEEWDYWWWFRYSRVVQDRALDDRPIDTQPIAEFPNFSFVLSDNHPHVLALPFAVLAVGLALNLVMGGRALRLWEYPLYAIWIGGMVFMNSWDAIYLPLLFGAEVLRRFMRRGTGVIARRELGEIALFVAGIGSLTLVFYAPWIMSFTSQARGLLPNVIFPTAWQQLFLQFGTFLVILTVFVLVEIRRAGRLFNRQAGILFLWLVFSTALLLLVVLGVSAWGQDDVRHAVYRVYDQSGGLDDLLPDILERRLSGLPGELLLLFWMLAVVGRLFPLPRIQIVQGDREKHLEYEPDRIAYSPATGFALLLVGAGAVLVFVPDFVYLHDNFSVRINTVFKLYYQGWVLFSLAGAFAVWSILAGVQPGRLALAGRIAFGVAVVVLFTAGMIYPIQATRSRGLIESGREREQDRIARCESDPDPAVPCGEMSPVTLDGVPDMINADEYAVLQCFMALEDDKNAVIAEAPGGAYAPDYSRFSGLSGIPTLIGWQNHESQWRGDTYSQVIESRVENGVRRDRVSDVQDLYTTQDWDRAWAVIDRYAIDYVVIGGAEREMINRLAGDNQALRSDYEVGLGKFAQIMQPVCVSGDVAVYRVKPS